MEDIYQAYDKYHGAYDVVLMEGATQEMIGSNFMEVNAEVWVGWPKGHGCIYIGVVLGVYNAIVHHTHTMYCVCIAYAYAYQSHMHIHNICIPPCTPITPYHYHTITPPLPQIAANLNAPVVMVARGDGGETATQLHDRAKIGAQVFQLAKADVVGLIINKAPAKDRSLIASQLTRRLADGPISFLGALPFDSVLSSIRLDQIHASLGAQVCV